ncbi:ATP-binding protein [Arenibaculum pallidiluteum]|uniref:ATP-binding protein n=1 Tax=Arenibaculum pallidiluteum TaxID=2812559 RepID=UPI001A962692|nr:winged helix-turn-helix domain-containing protein [Arenibaculum pallidiluteum]
MAGGYDIREGDVVSFGAFRLFPTRRALFRDGEPVQLGSRALDILVALVERAGEVVPRRDLIDRVWPDLVVEEGNLRVHIANLRRVLGDGRDGARYVANIPGRGYCFVAPVGREAPPPADMAGNIAAGAGAAAAAGPAALPSVPRLPPRLARMVGRDETVAALSGSLARHRFVSVVGPGGMGKTTVAVSVAHSVLDDFGQAVFFVDLGSLADSTLVNAAVATALGFVPQAEDPLPGLLAFLAGRRILLVLDNCEHVVDAAATLAERLYSQAPHLFILTTSREALRAEGEHVHLLHPLDTPPSEEGLTAAQALAWPAIQLFMERAASGGYRSALTDEDAPIVAGICQRLDGLALAIELAAGRVGSYGIRGTAELLDNRFKLLWQGRRSALPRHQTMQAMLDWSYNLLSERDRCVLRRLSTFAGIFTLEAAQDVASDLDVPPTEVAEALSSLVDRSLVWASAYSGAAYYRLLDTTRSYAALKLAQSDEADAVARRHALHYCRRLAPETTPSLIAGGGDLPAQALLMGNIRAALEWSFSGHGDGALGVDLAARAAPLFLGLSLLHDCQRWCELGLARLDEADRGSAKELSLQAALAISAMFTKGNGREIRAAIERGLNLASALGSSEYELHLLAGLHIFLTRIGEFHDAVRVAERSATVAAAIGDPSAGVMADWMLGTAYHLIGDHAEALRYCERGLRRAAAGVMHVDFFGFDHRVRALIVLVRALWLRGFADQSARVAVQAIAEAERREQPVTLCIALIYTTTASIWAGELETAGQRAARLVEHAAKHSLGPYHAVGLALQGEIAIRMRQAPRGVSLLREALGALRAEQHQILTTPFLRALAEGLAECGQFDEASATIDGTLARARERGEAFHLPDLLRARGEILLTAPGPDLAAAEAALLRAVQCAQTQSAPGWELRAALPLARLWLRQGRRAEAREMLSAALHQFTEGFGTADLREARRLLHEAEHMGLTA